MAFVVKVRDSTGRELATLLIVHYCYPMPDGTQMPVAPDRRAAAFLHGERRGNCQAMSRETCGPGCGVSARRDRIRIGTNQNEKELNDAFYALDVALLTP